MTKNTLELLKQEKIIAIIRGIPSTQITDLARAIRRGGVICMEVTFDQRSQEGLEETARCIRLLAQEEGLCVGAGTVMNPEQVQMARDAGAQYIISPNVDEAVIRATKEMGLVSIPGAFTPTEVAQAYRLGADLVKVFPAGEMGPSYIKALRGPYSHIPMLAVGGIRASNCQEYFQAGCLGIGVGGNLVSGALVEAGRFDEITAAAQEYAAILHPDRA